MSLSLKRLISLSHLAVRSFVLFKNFILRLSRFISARVILSRHVLIFYFLWSKTVHALKDKIEQLESTLTRTNVSLVDPYALIAALEQLADVSRETVHPLSTPIPRGSMRSLNSADPLLMIPALPPLSSICWVTRMRN